VTAGSEPAFPPATVAVAKGRVVGVVDVEADEFDADEFDGCD
jgi:hypothetical protein